MDAFRIEKRDDLADALKTMRADSGLTAAQAARKAGMSPSMVTQAENGDRIPYLPRLLDLLGAYDYDLVVVKRGDLS